MEITLNNEGFVENYAVIGGIEGSITVQDPQDMPHFSEYYEAYRFVEGKLIFDEERQGRIKQLHQTEDIRKQREAECFSICDRAAWFYSLSEEQKAEVQHWRQAWLDAPETGVMPVKPVWID